MDGSLDRPRSTHAASRVRRPGSRPGSRATFPLSIQEPRPSSSTISATRRPQRRVRPSTSTSLPGSRPGEHEDRQPGEQWRPDPRVGAAQPSRSPQLSRPSDAITPRREARLPRPCSDGEPERAGGRHLRHPGDRHGGAGGGGRDGHEPAPRGHRRRRQGLRLAGLRRRAAESRADPHVAQHRTNRVRAIDARTTRHPGYAVSQQQRKLVEELLGSLETVALFRKTRHRGVRRIGWLFTLGAALYDPVRIRNLIQAEATP
jgi:hypothetical protein